MNRYTKAISYYNNKSEKEGQNREKSKTFNELSFLDVHSSVNRSLSNMNDDAILVSINGETNDKKSDQTQSNNHTIRKTITIPTTNSITNSITNSNKSQQSFSSNSQINCFLTSFVPLLENYLNLSNNDILQFEALKMRMTSQLIQETRELQRNLNIAH